MSDLNFTRRWALGLPVAALLLASTLAGCGKKEAPESSTPAPAPTSTPTASAPAGPSTAPGGPGGTMMHKPSANPHGATGDAIITAKVKSALIRDKIASGINVDTKSNVVVLRGTVKTAQDKAKAMADAKATKGVTKVINQLTVKP